MVAAPFHVIAFIAITSFIPRLEDRPWMGICAALMVLYIFSRTLLWIVGEKVLNRRNGVRLWRWIFGINAFALGLTWGVPTALNFLIDGMTTQGSFMLAACFGVSSLYTSAYGLDLTIGLIFQSMIMLPTIAMLSFGISIPGHTGFAVAAALWLGYSFYASFSGSRLQIALLKSTDTIEEQNRSIVDASKRIQGMLDSIKEAFLIFELNGICANITSERAKTLLGKDPTGRSIAEVLHATDQAREGLESWFRVLAKDQLDFYEQARRGPKLIEDPSTAKILSVEFHPLRDQAGRLTSIILTAIDITAESKSRKAAESAREQADMTLRIRDNMISFRSFLKETDQQLHDPERFRSIPEADTKRFLHTLKGTTALFGASGLSRMIFQVECRLREFSQEISSGKASTQLQSYIVEEIKALRGTFEQWKAANMILFAQLGVFDEEQIEIPRSRFEQLEQVFASNEELKSAFAALKNQFQHATIEELLSIFSSQAKSTAEQLGKAVTLSVKNLSGHPIFVPRAAYLEVFRSFIHLFNNAIDHGIETPAARRSAGKPESGMIEVSYDRVSENGDNWILLKIRDDGAGIDVAKLRATLQSKGNLISQHESDLNVMQFVFTDGFSTKNEVSTVSGQGIGMGAVRAAVLKARGKIRVARSDRNGTEFEIRLPDKSIEPGIVVNSGAVKAA